MKVKQAIYVILIILFLLPLICAPSMSCAHNRLRVAEDQDQGQSNYGDMGDDKVWEGYWDKHFASLIIQSIECKPDNKLSVIVVIQPAYESGESLQYEWEAEGKVYFDGEEMGVFDIRNPAYPEGGINLYSYSRYTYLLPWEITAPVMVRVVIRATVLIEDSDFPASRDFFRQVLVEPPSNTSNIPSNTSDTPSNTSANRAIYIPLLLGFFGLSLVIWVGYQRYGTRLFCRRRKS